MFYQLVGIANASFYDSQIRSSNQSSLEPTYDKTQVDIRLFNILYCTSKRKTAPPPQRIRWWTNILPLPPSLPPPQRIRWWTNILVLLLLLLLVLVLVLLLLLLWLLWVDGCCWSGCGCGCCGWFRCRGGQPKSEVKKLEGGWSVCWWTNILLLLLWLLWLLWVDGCCWRGCGCGSCDWFRRRGGQPKSEVKKLEGGWGGGRSASPPAHSLVD